MSVEDIDYLHENSEIDNFILYADSAVRDRDIFPYPNHYSIHFDQPFKNVVGIEILDASIPSTMYNVEVDANGLAGFTYVLNKTVTTQTTDYSTTLQSYLNELEHFDEFDTALNKQTVTNAQTASPDTENLNRVTGQIVVSTFELIHLTFPSQSMTDPGLANDWNYDEIPYATNSPYWLFRRGVIVNAPVYKYIDDISIAKGQFPLYKITFDGTVYAIINDPDNSTYQDLINKAQQYRPVIKENSDGTIDFIYYQIDNVQQSAILTLSNVSNPIRYLMTMTFFYSSIIPGNYSGTSILVEAKRVMAGTNVAVNASSSSDISIQPKLKFTSNFPFVLNMETSTSRSSLGFDEYSEPSNAEYVKLYYKDNKRLFGSSYNAGAETWNLAAPGVIYLLGTRYCILHCREIEGHMYGSLSYDKFSPGIGMFKMYAVNDIAHQRFDFLNFKKRNFHPIGKLDRLTLKFQRSDGTMYDFKGANHLILICIKYLVPVKKGRKFERSILNPNYTYDFNAYMVRHMDFKEPSDIDDDDDNQDIQLAQSDFKNKFAKKELQYDYSTSEDGDDNDSNSNDSEINYMHTIRN